LWQIVTQKSTNPDVVTQASIVPPQITQIFLELADLGLPTDLIGIDEAREALLNFLGVNS